MQDNSRPCLTTLNREYSHSHYNACWRERICLFEQVKWTPKSRQKHTEFKLYIPLHTQRVGAAPVLAFNLNAYLNAQNAVHYVSGVSTGSHANNPNISGGASGVIGASTNAVTPATPQSANSVQLSSQGVRFNHQANQTNAMNVPDSIMRWTTSKTVTSPIGSLPPTP